MRNRDSHVKAVKARVYGRWSWRNKRTPPEANTLDGAFVRIFALKCPRQNAQCASISVIGSCSQKTFPMPSLALIPARLAVESISSLSSKDVVEPPFLLKKSCSEIG